jgi:hypothetical protein
VAVGQTWLLRGSMALTETKRLKVFACIGQEALYC